LIFFAKKKSKIKIIALHPPPFQAKKLTYFFIAHLLRAFFTKKYILKKKIFNQNARIFVEIYDLA
jgi:hypothetical protein